MSCHNCRIECKRFGKHRNGLQRFRCRQCRKTFTEAHQKPLDSMYLPVERAVQVLTLLTEGCSVSTVERYSRSRLCSPVSPRFPASTLLLSEAGGTKLRPTGRGPRFQLQARRYGTKEFGP